MKYILFEDAYGRKIPVTFPEVLVHADVATAMQNVHPMRVVSAGFVLLKDVVVSGGSETLEVESREADAAYLEYGDSVAMMPEETVMQIVASMEQLKEERIVRHGGRGSSKTPPKKANSLLKGRGQR